MKMVPSHRLVKPKSKERLVNPLLHCAMNNVNFLMERVYGAVLAFSTSIFVVRGVKTIAEQLIARNYEVKFTYTVSTTV